MILINVINGERTRMRLLGRVFLGSTIIASKERLLCNSQVPSCSSKHTIQKSSSPQIAIEKIKNIYIILL